MRCGSRTRTGRSRASRPPPTRSWSTRWAARCGTSRSGRAPSGRPTGWPTAAGRKNDVTVRVPVLGLLAAAAVVAGCGSDEPEPTVTQIAAPAPLETCSQVYYGGPGRPDVLIASDIPLQGTYAHDGRQGTRAVRVVLEERGFSAGRFRVGYVSCDGSTPTEDSSPAKCRRSGRAYVAASSVVAVIGPFFSSCAIYMMPVLNR